MTLWDELVGQDEAIEQMRRATQPGSPSMTHAWLITGPPGSGRSTLAHAFAAELVGAGGEEAAWRQVVSGAHPDVSILATDRVTITIDEVRSLVSRSYFSPSLAAYRVIIIEDADRMTDRTSNVLLKALEEPPPQTVWILCAPSPADVLPTIRSRMRSITLQVPSPEDVARLIVSRHTVSHDDALVAAREAQSHIGMATRLATDEKARERRAASVDAVLSLPSVSKAVNAAQTLLDIAKDDAAALVDQQDSEERDALLRTLGVAPGGTIPPAVRSQVKTLEDDQKRRATRSLRDAVDRILVDVLSILRDVVMIQVGADVELVNQSHRAAIEERAWSTSPETTLRALDAVYQARARMAQNSPPLMILEALLITVSGRTESLGAH
jgi:DNA polymerase III subunit delta'